MKVLMCDMSQDKMPINLVANELFNTSNNEKQSAINVAHYSIKIVNFTGHFRGETFSTQLADITHFRKRCQQ